jgi:hypothetical protein
LLDTLVQQQKQIATSAGELSKNVPNSAAMNQAAQSAKEAAQQLAESSLAPAIDSMKAAQGAMQQAAQDHKSVPPLGQQQKEVQQTAEALLKTLQNAADRALQQAERSLENGGSAISPLTSGKFGPLPPSVQMPLQAAQGSMSQGAAQASSKQGVPSHSNASSAAKSLAQAQAALAMTQAGLGGQMAGKGQQPGQGQGQGQQPGNQPGKGQPNPQGTGRQGNWDSGGGAEGARRSAAGSSAFSGLPQRDRAAILQSQSEKYPQEYGPAVEQYLKNLADQAENQK